MANVKRPSARVAYRTGRAEAGRFEDWRAAVLGADCEWTGVSGILQRLAVARDRAPSPLCCLTV